MARDSVFPYFYPTTVVFVDDNTGFLKSLNLQLPADLAYRLYESPVAALKHVNADSKVRPLYQRCFSHYRELDDESERLIHLDLSLIEREVSNSDRFGEIAVVVVDYDMPAMDGLEFCKQIRNPRIKKALFTGVADEKVAVAAFNEGIIDRFILKSEPGAIEIVDQTIRDLQDEYFREISLMLTNSLLLESPGFITDPAFARFFRDLRKRHNFVEYYLVKNPSGFLLLTDTGRLSRLIVLDDNELDRQIASAETQRAPKAVLDQLRNREAVAYFYETIDSYYDPGGYDWTDYVFEADQLEGTRRWYYALLDDPPVDIEFDVDTANYRAYLEKLDNEPALA